MHRRAVWFAAAITLCAWWIYPLERQADAATPRRSLIPAAAAADKVEQGPLSKIRVRCGTLSDKHGAKVLGRGAGGNARAESEHCQDDPAPPAQALQPARPAVAVKPAPPPVAKRTVEPPHRPRAQPPAANPIRVAAEWSSDQANRVERFTPTTATRLSTAIATGGVLWFLQSSFWASLLLLGLPIWRHVDLLAIAQRAPDLEAAEPQARPVSSEDEPVARVLDDGHKPNSQRVTS